MKAISNELTKNIDIKDETSPITFRKKSLANTSGASRLYSGKMSSKDRRLLKMILVIFLSFVTCYLPITVIKIFFEPSKIEQSNSLANLHFVFFIFSYLLIYVSVCLNPLIYVLMSKEYRKAYSDVCRFFCVQCGQ